VKKLRQLYLILAILLLAAASTNSKASITLPPPASQTSGSLYKEIAHVDSLMFNAFNSRNIEGLKRYFDLSLEVYQDNTGLRNYKEAVSAFTELFKKDYVLTRTLVPGSMEVYPIKDYGAIQTGRHMFSHIENGKLQQATFKFMQIWQKKDGTWKITRLITYDH
jgi:hypothetical protein